MLYNLFYCISESPPISRQEVKLLWIGLILIIYFLHPVFKPLDVVKLFKGLEMAGSFQNHLADLFDTILPKYI